MRNLTTKLAKQMYNNKPFNGNHGDEVASDEIMFDTPDLKVHVLTVLQTKQTKKEI